MKILQCIIMINVVSIITCNFSTKIKKRVAGGSHAAAGEFPYVVLSVHTDVKCTAVIISPIFVLGAAHCYWANKRPVRSNEVAIVTGLTNINQINDSHIQKRIAQQIIINPKFREKKLGRYDIALVQLNSALEFNDFTSAIRIDDTPFPIAEEVPCTVIGWGDIGINMEATNLFKLDVNAEHSHDACHGLTKQQYSSLLCVQEPRSGRGLCDGDSGGPLIYRDRLVGIAHQVYKELQDNDTDFDLSCGMKGLVHTFMFICKHLNWIKLYEKRTPDQPEDCYILRDGIEDKNDFYHFNT